MDRRKLNDNGTHEREMRGARDPKNIPEGPIRQRIIDRNTMGYGCNLSEREVKDLKREQAKERQKAWAELTIEQKVTELMARPGNCEKQLRKLGFNTDGTKIETEEG